MQTSTITDLALPVEGVDLRNRISLEIPAPATPTEIEALAWFLGQQPGDTLQAIVRAFQDDQLWQQKVFQSMSDGQW